MDERVVVGVDLGGTNVRAAAARRDGDVVRTLREPTDAAGGVAVVAQIARLVRAVAGDGRAPDAVAVATAGVVAPGSAAISVVNNIRGWRDSRPEAALAAELAAPVLVENDANLAALGELRRGAGRGAASLAFVSVGTGLGMGLVLDGHVVRGARGGAGELGYLPLAPRGVEPAGRPLGAFERGVCGAGVVAAAGAHPRWDEPPPAAAGEVFALAAAGFAPAAEVVAEVGRQLGAAIATVCAVVDPEVVVLGGGVGANELLLEPARAAASELLPLEPRIERTLLGDDAALHGAVALALDYLRGSDPLRKR